MSDCASPRLRALAVWHSWNQKHGFVQGNTDQFVPWRAPPWRMPAGTVGTWGVAGETALFGDMGVKDIDKARAAADFVTARVDDNGLWNAFSHLHLI